MITYHLLLITYYLRFNNNRKTDSVKLILEINFFANCFFSIFSYNENIRILNLSDRDEKTAGRGNAGYSDG